MMNRKIRILIIIMLLTLMTAPTVTVTEVMAEGEQDTAAAVTEEKDVAESSGGDTADQNSPGSEVSDDETQTEKEETQAEKEETETEKNETGTEEDSTADDKGTSVTNNRSGDNAPENAAETGKQAESKEGKEENKDSNEEEGLNAPLVKKARMLAAKGDDDEPIDLNTITWKITGTKIVGSIGYHIRTITHINGKDVDSSSEMRSSYAYCVEPNITGPEGKDAKKGDSYTAVNGPGESIYTFDGSNDGEYARMRKMCYYVAGGYGWNSRTCSWYNEYKKSVSENEFNDYTLSAIILAKQWGKDASDAEGNANYAYNRLSDKGKALVDRFLNEVPGLPDPPETYIAFYVAKEGHQDIWGSLYAEPESGFVTVKKKSSEPSLTGGLGSIYSLAGAKYCVYTDSGCTEKAQDLYNKDIVLTTDASGNTNTARIRTGKYWVKEVSAPKGYDLDTKVYPVTVASKETAIAVSGEKPAYAVFNAVLEKESEEYGYRRLIGAEYTLKYYETDPGTTDLSGLKPKKTWVFRVREGTLPGTHRKAAVIDFLNDDPVSGGSMYKVSGTTVMPLGVFTLKETKAPKGLGIDPVTYMGKVERPSAGAAPKATINGSDDLYVDYTDRFELLNIEPVKSIKLNIHKKDADTGNPAAQGQESPERKADFGSLEGAVYEVYMNDPYVSEDPKVGEMTTDSEGKASLDTDIRTGKGLMPGTYYIKEVKASAGYVTDNNAEKEIRNKYEEGRHIINARVDDTSEKLVFEYDVDSMEAPHHTLIHKTDITTGREIPGATLQVIDSEGTIVEEWISEDKPHDIVALPDGKYTLREITAPDGYEVAEDAEFEVKDDTVKCEVTMQDKPADLGGIAGTTALGTDTFSHIASAANETISITDTVRYEGLIPGATYRIEGELYDKTEGRLTGIVSTSEFIPEQADGYTEVVFSFKKTELAGHTMVAYENLYIKSNIDDKTVLVDKHNNPDDEDQTVYIPKIETRIGKKDGDAVTDTVTYTNLIPGMTYAVRGYFVRKKDGAVVNDSDGWTAFTPTEPSGEVDVKLYPGSAKGDLVAFETLYLVTGDEKSESIKEVFLCEHKDLKSEAQTYSAVTGPASAGPGPKTGGRREILPYAALFTAALAALMITAVCRKYIR